MQSLLLWQFTYRLKPAFSSQLWIVFLIFPSCQKALYLFHIEDRKHLGGNRVVANSNSSSFFWNPLICHRQQETIYSKGLLRCNCTADWQDYVCAGCMYEYINKKINPKTVISRLDPLHYCYIIEHFHWKTDPQRDKQLKVDKNRTGKKKKNDFPWRMETLAVPELTRLWKNPRCQLFVQSWAA